jgi:hypothetical protein
LVAWFPSRSRKLLPRFITAAPADKSELMDVGTGVGEGVGIGVGEGLGLGVGVGEGLGEGLCA